MAENIRTLLVFDGDTRAANLTALDNCDLVAAIGSGQSLSDAVARFDPELILLESATANDGLLRRLAGLYRGMTVPVALRARPRDFTQLRQWVEAGVDIILPPGINAEDAQFVLELAILNHRRCQTLDQQLSVARNQLKDRKLVERAKGMLMKQKGLDETAAYELLRRSAMKRQQRIGEVAENLITAAEVLAD